MIQFGQIPQRIVSLVPSLTETLFDLNLGERIIGCTKFCVHPNEAKQKCNIIGGTKNPRVQDILSLSPDLIIANKEENRLEDIDDLKRHCKVWTSDIKTIEDCIYFNTAIGNICGVKTQADTLNLKLHEIVQICSNNVSNKKTRVVYLIWKDPYMVVGGDTFIHYILEMFGFENAFHSDLRYPEKTITQIQNSNADIIFFSSEPYPFKQEDLQWIQNIPGLLVDGEAFSWYGSRIVKKFEYLMELKKKFEIK